MTRTRFAPAPTGYLHLGHVASALAVWRLAEEYGAEVLLRIEDHDRQRSRPEYEAALLDDLDWLGFEPDVYPTDAFRAGVCESRQRDREETYAREATRLIDAGRVYGCRCSRREIAARAGGPEAGTEPRYPGTCRELGLAPADGLAWRLEIAPGEEAFDDLIRGPQVQDPAAECGDVMIRDRKGNWTYQFVASVDDYLQGIDLVVRGRDLLASTGRQIRIARLVGRPVPATFAHHGLVMRGGGDGEKLSKSNGDTGVRELRAAGWSPAEVRAEADRLTTA